jgi:hypothetical protein
MAEVRIFPDFGESPLKKQNTNPTTENDFPDFCFEDPASWRPI